MDRAACHSLWDCPAYQNTVAQFEEAAFRIGLDPNIISRLKVPD